MACPRRESGEGSLIYQMTLIYPSFIRRHSHISHSHRLAITEHKKRHPKIGTGVAVATRQRSIDPLAFHAFPSRNLPRGAEAPHINRACAFHTRVL